MSDFVFLFRSGGAAYREAMGTPERAQKSLEAWISWIRDLENCGHLKDRGLPLERTGSLVSNGVVTDGPYAESKDLVLGFIVVEARDMAEAVELAQKCPIALSGAVEVRPVQDSMRNIEKKMSGSGSLDR